MSSKKLLFIISLLLIVFIISCANKKDNYIGNKYLKIKLNEVENLDFHNDYLKKYLCDYYTRVNEYANGIENKDYSLPIVISWNSKIKRNIEVNYQVIISLNDEVVKEIATKDNKVEIYNLYLDTKYDYELISIVDDIEVLNIKSSFKTLSTKVRTIYIDGIKNVRDLGGYNLKNENKLKEGLLYRSARFNESNADIYKEELTFEGLKQFKELKIKTEIDLRQVYECGDRINNHSYIENYFNIPMTSTGNVISMNKEKIVEVFEILGNIENYPIIFHCDIGVDRTGAIAFLVGALLGMKIEDLYYDYLISNFSNIGSSRSLTAIDEYLKLIKTYNDEELSSKTEEYLIKIGVKKETINKIKNILIY